MPGTIDRLRAAREAPAMPEDIVCGLKAVTAVFDRRPDSVRRLLYTESMRTEVGGWCKLMAAAHRSYRMVEAADLAGASGTTHHGGVAAFMAPRTVPILHLSELPKVPFLLVLDGVGNPHNLGAIARSAAFFAVSAMLIGEGPGHALPSDAAYRTAGGGLEWLDLYRTRDLPGALAAMTPHYRTVAATLDDEAMDLDKLPRDRPIALVLGNEERGISAPVLAACRRHVRIPGRGRIQSLNVAQAAAVLIHTLCP